jgi:arginase
MMFDQRTMRSEGTTAACQQNRLLTAPIRPVVVPLWLGCERRGVDTGALALDAGLRQRWDRPDRAHLADRLRETVTIPVHEPAEADARLGRGWHTFLAPIGGALRVLADVVVDGIESGELVTVLGGDHVLALGSLAGVTRAAERPGILWIDTHPDLNTPATSPSGHIHGMPLAAACGIGPEDVTSLAGEHPWLDPENICLLGVRDIDPGEKRLITTRDIWTLTMEEWTDAGIVPGLDAALAHLARRGVDAVHLSFDLDVLDPAIMPGTGTRVPGGLALREASQVVRRLGAWDGPLHSFDWVELNPALDPTGHSTTVATMLLATALGERMV